MNYKNSGREDWLASRTVMVFTGVLLVAFIVVARLIPHAANFAPAVAVGLLTGYAFGSRWNAYALVLIAMFLSDLFLGYDSLAMRAVVYASLGLPVLLGRGLRESPVLSEGSRASSRLKFAAALGGSSLVASVVFFLTTNFAVWIEGALYEISWAGLATCYVNAIPFFRNAVVGDLAYAAILFTAWSVVQHAAPRTATVPSPAN